MHPRGSDLGARDASVKTRWAARLHTCAQTGEQAVCKVKALTPHDDHT